MTWLGANNGRDIYVVDADGRIVLLFGVGFKGVIRVLEGTLFVYAEV